MNATMRAETIDDGRPCGVPARRRCAGGVVLLTAVARGQPVVEELERPDGRRVPGRIEGDARSGFRFAPTDGGPRDRDGAGDGRSAGRGGPPERTSRRRPARRRSTCWPARPRGSRGCSGAVTAVEVRWAPDWQSGAIAMPRGCVQSIVQRPGEARVLADSFEAIDPSRWSVDRPSRRPSIGRGWTRSGASGCRPRGPR